MNLRNARRNRTAAIFGLTFALTVAAGLPGIVHGKDVVTRRSTATRPNGEIKKISRTEIVINTGLKLDKPETIPVNDVVQIEWDNQPGGLSGLRTAEAAGRHNEAAEGYEKLLQDPKITNDNLKTDLKYFALRARGKNALSGSKDDLEKAAANLEAFRTANPNSYHYFELTELLVDLHLTGKAYDKAIAAIEDLRTAPWKDVKLTSNVAEARVMLAQDKPAEAAKLYDAVLADAGTDASLRRLRIQAQMGKAAALQKTGKDEAALTALKQVVDDAEQSDGGVLAEAYVLQGDSYRALNQNKDALMAYLRVDILFPNETRHRAKALYYLSQLWASVNNPQRASEAKNRLLADFPDSSWATE